MNTSNALGDDRRGFLTKTAAVLCGGAACAAPIALGAAAFFHPLRLKGQAGQFVRLASLDILPADGSPRKFPVIAQRTDAWSRFPDEPVGMVFLRRLGKGQVEALQVVCPHAGCHIDFDQKEQPVLLSLSRRSVRHFRQAARPGAFAQPSRHGRPSGRGPQRRRGLGQV